jgi:hypothetical protein
MNTLTLQRPRRFTASSSRQVEELAVPSGLPMQASIAGCLSSRGQPEEWVASLERLGQERSKVEELRSHVPTQLEEGVLEQLFRTLVLTAWVGETDQPRTPTGCTFLTSCGQLPSLFRLCSHVYLVRLELTELPKKDGSSAGSPALEGWEPVAPDTDRAYTVQQMARAWEAIGKPITKDDVPLSVDPDGYPLF